MTSGIYKITNNINGKIYIGQSVHIERRWNEHKRPSGTSMISIAIKKYGIENFSFEILENITPDQRQLMDEREAYYIQHYNSIAPYGYNLVAYDEHNLQSTSYTTIDAEQLKSIVYDLQNTDKSFEQIATEHNIHIRTMSRINQGQTHYNKELVYPLRSPKIREITYCCDCGVQIDYKATRCLSCSYLASQTVQRPSREELKNLIRKTPFTRIGAQFGVSDNAIRKWCKAYGLPYKTTEIKRYTDDEWELI